MPRDVLPLTSRRQFLKASGLAALSTTLPRRSMAEGEPVSILMSNTVVSGPLRAILEGKIGAKIIDGPFVSSTDNVSKLMAPGVSQFDLFAGVSEFSRVPVLGKSAGSERGLAFDPALIPNMSNLIDAAKRDIGERDGTLYVVPIYSGYDMVIFNRDHVPEDDPLTQSWGLLFSEKYAGRIAWFDAPHQMLMVAGLHLGHAAPEKADAADLKTFAEFLTKKKSLVRAMWTKPAQAVSLMASGEIVVTYGQIPVRVALQKQGMNVTNNWPSESVLVWSNGAYMPKTAKNPEGAQKLVNAFLSEDYGAAFSRETGYLSVSKVSIGRLSAEERRTLGYDVAERGIKIYSLKYPPDYPKWVEAWGKVKSA